MKPYPFSPAVLDALPEELAELFRSLEMTLLDEICTRLDLSGQLNEVTIQDIRALRSHGIELDEIKKAISKTTSVGKKTLDELLDDVVVRNQQYYSELITIADVTKPETLVDAATISAIKEQCQREYGNITRSMGFLVDNGRTMLDPAKAYQWALDNAEMQIQSGAVNYNQAIKNAVKQLSDSGIKTVACESGHVDQIDVATRRAVMTGVNQINRKYAEQSMEYLGTDLVEVSAHIGARNVDGPNGWENHEKWQGKWYRWAAYTEQFPGASSGEYPDFEATCGFGDVTGILGANCRHSYSPVIEGVNEPTYSAADLDRLKAENNKVVYDGREYDGYQATQMQRRLERTIRKQKRLLSAYKAAGLTEDAQTAQIRLNRLNAKYREFSEAAGLPEQRERMRVTYTDDKSVAAAERLKERRAAESSYIKSANDTGAATPGTAEIVGRVDFDDKQAVINRLNEAERELQGLDYEVNYSVTSDGKVWRVSGESSKVNLSGIESSLQGSYSYHNHPEEQTNYSFSADDVAFFISNKEHISIASDGVYRYMMERTSETIEKTIAEVYHRFKEIEKTDVFEMKWNGVIDPDLDGYHETMKILSEELKFKYAREKKG